MIVLIIFHLIYGAFFIQFIYFFYADFENMYTQSYLDHRKYDSIAIV